jgi:hypothetical protein
LYVDFTAKHLNKLVVNRRIHSEIIHRKLVDLLSKLLDAGDEWLTHETVSITDKSVVCASIDQNVDMI